MAQMAPREVDQINVKTPRYYGDTGGDGWYAEYQIPYPRLLASKYKADQNRHIFYRSSDVQLWDVKAPVDERLLRGVYSVFGKIETIKPMSSKQVGGNRYQNVIILFAPEVLADKVIEVARRDPKQFGSFSAISEVWVNQHTLDTENILLVKKGFGVAKPGPAASDAGSAASDEAPADDWSPSSPPTIAPTSAPNGIKKRASESSPRMEAPESSKRSKIESVIRTNDGKTVARATRPKQPQSPTVAHTGSYRPPERTPGAIDPRTGQPVGVRRSATPLRAEIANEALAQAPADREPVQNTIEVDSAEAGTNIRIPLTPPITATGGGDLEKPDTKEDISNSTAAEKADDARPTSFDDWAGHFTPRGAPMPPAIMTFGPYPRYFAVMPSGSLLLGEKKEDIERRNPALVPIHIDELTAEQRSLLGLEEVRAFRWVAPVMTRRMWEDNDRILALPPISEH